MYVPGADPGLVVRGAWVGEGSRGPLKVPSWSGVEPWYGQSPPEALGILGITDIYLNDNFEPTTPFLSDPKNLILSLNCCRIIVNSIFLSDYKNLKSNFFWATVMRIVQLMTDRSRYFNPSKNYWFSFNAFFISLIGLYFRCLSFRVVLVNYCPSGWSVSFCRLIHSLKTYDSTVLVYRQTKAEIVNTWTCYWFLIS